MLTAADCTVEIRQADNMSTAPFAAPCSEFVPGTLGDYAYTYLRLPDAEADESTQVRLVWNRGADELPLELTWSEVDSCRGCDEFTFEPVRTTDSSR